MKLTYIALVAGIPLLMMSGSFLANAASFDLPDISCPAGLNCATLPSSESITGNPLAGTPGNPAAYIARLYQIALAIAGILAVAIIVTGSLFYTFAGGNTDRQREGKDMITSALWGVALLFGSYLILNTINPELVTLDPLRGPYASTTSERISFAGQLGKCSPESITGLTLCPPGQDEDDVPGCVDGITLNLRFSEMSSQCSGRFRTIGGATFIYNKTNPSLPAVCHPFYKKYSATSTQDRATYNPDVESPKLSEASSWKPGEWQFCGR